MLDVDSRNDESIENAVSAVLQCYKDKDSYSPDNQVLIQSQTKHVSVSGVVFTRDAVLNRPYYVINYDDRTAKTDSVTSGAESTKVEILRNVHSKEIPDKWKKLIAAVREIEKLLSGMVLDIEFAIRTDSKGRYFSGETAHRNKEVSFF